MQRIAGVAVTSLVLLFACSSPPSDSLREGSARATLASLTKRFALREAGALASSVRLPSRATEATVVEDHRSGIGTSFRLRGARDVAGVTTGASVVYPGAVGGADLVRTPALGGVEDFVAFEQRPAIEELVYDVDVRKAAGVRSVGNTVELLDATGSPVLRVAAPWFADAKQARHPAKLTLSGCEYALNAAAPFSGQVVAAGADTCTVHVRWHSDTYPILVDPEWTATGKMLHKRYGHSALKLPSGRVLIVGGLGDADNEVTNRSAEIYDPKGNAGAGAFVATGLPTTVRELQPSLTLLSSGKVLWAGGSDADSNYLDSLEVFDPNLNGGTFTALAVKTSIPRNGHSATRLPNGKILFAGGRDSGTSPAEIFDPTLETFALTGGPTAERYWHAATVLTSGDVLLVSGANSSGSRNKTAEIYETSKGTFRATGSLTDGDIEPYAFSLPGDKAIFVGQKVFQMFDLAANGNVGAFASATKLVAFERQNSGAVMLTTGQVLLAGGETFSEVIDPTAAGGAGATTKGPTNQTARDSAVLTALDDGQALLSGGFAFVTQLDTAERIGTSIGAACKTAGECLSGFCANGVCCATACSDGPCERCNVPGKEGTCTREKGYASTCTPPFVCDGVSAECPKQACETDEQCSGATYCSSKQCVAKKANGTSCTDKKECASDSCADGVCCNTACGDNCTSCSAALKESGKDGECGPTKRGTDPKNKCEPSSTACANDGFCDGLGECRTVTPTDVSCGASVCQGNVANGQFCNGSGECKPKTIDCAPFKCGATGCATTCTASADCAETAYCNAGKCTALESAGRPCTSNDQCSSHSCDSVAKVCVAGATCDGDHTTTAPNGTKQDCSPFKCESTGTCLAKCTKVDDCAAPALCDASGACVFPSSASDSDDGGCQTSPRSAGEATSFAALGVLALAFRRRRRQNAAV